MRLFATVAAGWQTLIFRHRLKRAVKHFNTMLPQQRLVVSIQMLRENPELAKQFRRALQMDDAKQPERRIELVRSLPRR
jgi:hypothetical protein